MNSLEVTPTSAEAISVPSVFKDLNAVQSRDFGLFASASRRYGKGAFGRDAERGLDDLLEASTLSQWVRHRTQGIGERVIAGLIRFQGGQPPADPDELKRYIAREEKEGAYHHEHRNALIDGEEVSEETQEIIRKLSPNWGGSDTEFTTYMSIDSPPYGVVVAGKYVKEFGRDFLDREFTAKHGETITVRESLLRAIGWIEEKIEASDLDLVEYKRMNEKYGHRIQNWMDSPHGVIHEDGTPVNVDDHIALIDVQALSDHALQTGIELFGEENPEKAAYWEDLSGRLRKATLDLMWMPEEQYFAMGIDRDENGNVRQIKTQSTLPAFLLNSPFFDKLHPRDREFYVSAVARKLMGPEFLTPVGVRTRALRHKDIVPFADYHGSWVSWYKETQLVANGLYRQGLGTVAQALEALPQNGVNISGKNTEFWYVTPDGRVTYDMAGDHPKSLNDQVIPGTVTSDEVQTWTVTSSLLGKVRRGSPDTNLVFTSWSYKLSEEILNQLPPIVPLRTLHAIQEAYPTYYSLTVDEDLGRQLASEYEKETVYF